MLPASFCKEYDLDIRNFGKVLTLNNFMLAQFINREDAGRRLAKVLSKYKGGDAVVCALPRGGVVTGYEIARELKLPLDIISVRKIGHPMAPEYAIGAVLEDGEKILNETEAASVDPKWLKEEIASQKAEALRRGAVYRPGGKMAKPLAVSGKTSIIVDDGVATGLTMRLAVTAMKARHPKKIVVAAPVAPAEAITALRKDGADEVVTLIPPEDFLGSVGAHYASFEQTKDDEVIRLMRLSQSQA